MKSAHVVEIVTPKKFILNGLWFGDTKPKKVVIWIHGLGSSVFSKQTIIENLAVGDTAVLSFNNRGHDCVVRMRDTTGKKNIIAGAAFEKFEYCVDDIQGAIDYVQSHGITEIYLAGHSTGCQKAIYWASKKGTDVKGIVLLAPMSDYAGAVHIHSAKKIAQLVKHAQSMIKSGTSDQLLPRKIWSEEPNSPERFISLYTPDSIEQSIFSYFDSRIPKIYSKVVIPILVVFAEKDEFADRLAIEIENWFKRFAKTSIVSSIISGADHGFKGSEVRVALEIQNFIK